MLAVNIAFVALALVFPNAAIAAKTPLFDGLSGPFNNDLSTMGYPKSVSVQKGIAVPDICKNYAKDAKCDLSKVTARRVKYSDCEDPWVLCRCGDANMSMDTLQRRWAKVPAGIRSYTGAVLAVKAGGCSALNYGGQFIRFHGNCNSAVFLHEAGHSLDAGFSREKRFTDANWTQNNVIVTWAKRHGGWPKLKAKNGKADCLRPQYDVINNDKRVTAAINAKKCIRDKRPFHVKRDLEETADAAVLMPEPFVFDARQAITCNFTSRGFDEELGEHSELYFDNEPFSDDE
ncbi:hypothetical protein BKA62DRAFT_834768 [Auriculariales sp. MPI-PUGE-AT-0066]|nr:hypothetical protein BKA62DRAFT_834768 [Auriculariales sp. MPI-PUGE-AT-0066]